MARSDLLLSLVRAGAKGDSALFRKTVEALVAEERAKQHHVLADRLLESFRENGKPSSPRPLSLDAQAGQLFVEVSPRVGLDDLILPTGVSKTCGEFIEEHHRSELLRSYSIEPRHKVLLAGPPGNGKTSLAEALAHALMVPLLVVRYEGVIGSFLGETATRLRNLFDFARSRHCVLFFDEFDTLGKERGDPHDTGEVKRVVSSLLLQIDGLPSHVVVVTATNHPELLDRAVWRRFQLRLQLPPPSGVQVQAWIENFQRRMGFEFGTSPQKLAEKLGDASFAELEEFGLDVARRWILTKPEGDIRRIVKDRLMQWENRIKPQG
ncbi:AAA family ATPase [Tundrisphaera sp. TA3]|uniref:AAA family ATPase n=1 Tax=Tundrisphaera sp. TA3 TaxID=3435775 RepID=UPI003EB75BDB